MTVPEFQSWVEFFKQNPFDDYHRFYRPAALVSHSMSGAPIDDLVGWLDHRPQADYTQADVNTMKSLGMKPPRN